MSSKTTKFNLHKIDLTDAPPDITVLNQNWDRIDAFTAEDFGAAKESQHQWESYSTLAQISSELTTDSTPFEVANAMKDYSVLCVVTGGSFSYTGGLIPAAENGVLTIKKATITRVIFEFVGELTGCYYAYLRSNESTFSGWQQVYSEKDGKTVKKSGDTMTGNLVIQNATPEVNLKDTSGMGGVRLYKNASADVDYGTYLMDVSNSDGTHDILVLNRDEKVNGKLYLRSQTEDGSSSTTYTIYGEHNTHVKIKTYSALSEIGLTTGSETISGIATNLPNNSILVVGITTSNATIYPSNYGLLTVKRSSGTRIEFNFVATSGSSFIGFYSITSSGDSWSDWKETASFSNYASKIQTGSYTGTGKYGSGNKKSLTFNFVPKMVVITTKKNKGNFFVWTYNNTYYFADAYKTYSYQYASLSGNTLTWYSEDTRDEEDTSSPQMNESSSTYYWTAIG